MTDDDFNREANKLIDTYGKNAYPPTRLKILYQEVKDFDGRWFGRVVDKLIADSRHAPMISDFREEISKERERMAYEEKKRHEADAQAFYRGTYQPEDARMVCQVIIKRMNQQISDEAYEEFLKGLERVSA